jgi:hypothetical protein
MAEIGSYPGLPDNETASAGTDEESGVGEDL